ncbi:TIGR03364 family FAD-dependent oxidoreductase [Mesorhizobium sp. SB112]|uniref:TIGR03364 family FAD-dependent oxidoreductase n=1 Tax=Mesorhizobium sp. SB112 TaxID=3151853 RepID=UPI0032649CCA
MQYDLAIVGAGIIGLAHALAAAKRGLRIVVIDRDAQANGASIRNFGLVVVSGQNSGAARRLAERSREVWLDIAQQAGIEVVHSGMLVAAQRPEALAVLEAFKSTEQGRECRILSPEDVGQFQPELDPSRIVGGLFSPFELRVESREAIPKLAAFLEENYGVAFIRGAAVNSVSPPSVNTSRGRVDAENVIVCPGDDLVSLYPERVAAYGVKRCKLQMLRLEDPGFKLHGALISDLSLLRYGGYAALPEAANLEIRLEAEQPIPLANGVHLIVVQSADGSLVVGDSHHYAATPDPFAGDDVDVMMLDEFAAIFKQAAPKILARWTGTYSSASGQEYFRDAPQENVRLVMVTSGTGASTGFAIGEETITELYG